MRIKSQRAEVRGQELGKRIEDRGKGGELTTED
jgi:hypothetical protein